MWAHAVFVLRGFGWDRGVGAQGLYPCFNLINNWVLPWHALIFIWHNDIWISLPGNYAAWKFFWNCYFFSQVLLFFCFFLEKSKCWTSIRMNQFWNDVMVRYDTIFCEKWKFSVNNTPWGNLTHLNASIIAFTCYFQHAYLLSVVFATEGECRKSKNSD